MSKTILFRFEANEKLGMGHWFRVQTLSSACEGCHILFCISNETLQYLHLGTDSRVRIVNSDEEVIDIVNKEHVECIVNDILNTSAGYIQSLKTHTKSRVVNLEDEGEGAQIADVVINELYESGGEYPNTYYGHRYCCLDPAIRKYTPNVFRTIVSNVVVLFGCTDPENLSKKTVRVLKQINIRGKLNVDVIAGPGYAHFAELEELANETSSSNIEIHIRRNVDIKEYMAKADFAVSSQGRTIFDLAYFNIPTIIMAQNERELLHTFACEDNGFVHLGLGAKTSDDGLAKALVELVENGEHRRALFERMSGIDLGNGLNEVLKLIL